MNNNIWPAIGVGTALVIFGLTYFRAQWRLRKSLATTTEMEERERSYLDRQCRRRMQTSALLAIVGLLIGLGDVLLPLQKHPAWPTFYWIGVLLLVLWIILLALGDLWIVSTRGKAELAHIRRRRQELERQIVEFKHQLDDHRKL